MLTSTPVTTTYMLTLQDVNESASRLRLKNTVTTVSEQSDTTSRRKVADIEIEDDALGTNLLSLSGPDAVAFEITGTELFFKAGVSLDYDVKDSYSVSVSVADPTITDSTALAEQYALRIGQINEAPTSIAINTEITSLHELTDTSARIRLANLLLVDDGIGDNQYTLSGADASAFELDASGLYLKAGHVLDFEAQADYSVTLEVVDYSVPGSTPVTVPYSLIVTDVNEAPSAIAITQPLAEIPETQDTTNAIALGVVDVSDDAPGTNTVTLAGPDASQFELVGNTLNLRAATTLNYDEQSSYQIEIRVEDLDIPGSTAISTAYTLRLLDINTAPENFTLANVVQNIAENTATPNRIRMAAFAVTDDAAGTNTFSLAGPDAQHFEADDEGLWLKQGVLLDYEQQATYDVTVTVVDNAIAGMQPLTADYQLVIHDVNESPSAFGLTNIATTNLVENTDISEPLRLADLQLSDDATGTNRTWLVGDDANWFELSNGALFLKAGIPLDFETQATRSVTVKTYDETAQNPTGLSYDFVVNVLDANEAPTRLIHQNAVAALPEGTDTTVRIELGSIVVQDDSLGVNTFTISGDDAASFEIENGSLYLKADTTIDFESQAAFEITVSVEDTTVIGSKPVTLNLTLAVIDINEAPTNAELLHSVQTLPETTDITRRLKVADIDLTDDALGTNEIAIRGAAAEFFEADVSGLYLKAGTQLDFETTPTLSIEINVVDPTTSATTPLTVNYTLSVSDENEAPTDLTITALTTTIDENTAISSPLHVADIVVTDDATKSFELLLLGPQANLFEIAGDSLYLKAGTSIDFETFSQISTQISTFEPDLIGSQSITREFILAVGDVNEAPSAITLSTELPFIPEGPIEERTLVASFSIDDDAIGTNVVTVSGDGSDLFEIDGDNLYLKAGVTLDFETKSLFVITVGAADEAVPGSTAVSASLSLEVLNVNYIQTAIEARGAVEFGTDSEGNLYAGDSPITFADVAV